MNQLLTEKLAEFGITWKISEPGHKPARWNPHGFHYKITLNREKISVSFDFWDSLHNYRNNIYLEDITCVLDCLFMDSFYGEYSFEEFCSECGYDSDSIAALRIHKAIKKQTEKLGKILNNEEITELYNIIQEGE